MRLRVAPETVNPTKKSSFGWALLLTLFFLFIFSLLFSRAMTTTLNHDEYQFVAGGELLAERGLLPYRDYPFLHMPYMVFANALVSRLTEIDFLAARLLTAACGLASAGLLFHFVFRLLEGKGKLVQSALACISVFLFVLNQAYIDANGRALNHALPNLLSLLALEAFYQGLKSKRTGLFFFFCGLMVGLAAGTRLTYAPAHSRFRLRDFHDPLLQLKGREIYPLAGWTAELTFFLIRRFRCLAAGAHLGCHSSQPVPVRKLCLYPAEHRLPQGARVWGSDGLGQQAGIFSKKCPQRTCQLSALLPGARLRHRCDPQAGKNEGSEVDSRRIGHITKPVHVRQRLRSHPHLAAVFLRPPAIFDHRRNGTGRPGFSTIPTSWAGAWRG